MKIKARTRAGSWDTFERRYQSVDAPDGTVMWQLGKVPEGTDPNHVWTVLDCDGKSYVVPGYCWVNRMGYVITKNPWPEIEADNPGYVY